MGKVMRSIVALLLVLVCANSVAFAAVEDDREFPEPLIGEEVEATDLIEKIEIASETSNDTSQVKEGAINLSDMAYVVLDDSHSVIDDNLSYSRATTSVSWSVKANHLKIWPSYAHSRPVQILPHIIFPLLTPDLSPVISHQYTLI